MPDYDTTSLANGVGQGLDQFARDYQNGKIADSIVRVNPEMLQMLGMSKEQFGAQSAQDRTAAISGAITAMGIKRQQQEQQQRDLELQNQSNTIAANLDLRRRMTNFNAAAAAALNEPSDPQAAPPGAAPIGDPAAQPGIAATLRSMGVNMAPQGVQPPLAPPVTQPSPIAGALQRQGMLQPPPANPNSLSGSAKKVLTAAFQEGVMGVPGADETMKILAKNDPTRFGRLASEQPPSGWRSPSGHDYVWHDKTLMRDDPTPSMDGNAVPDGYEPFVDPQTGKTTLVKTPVHNVPSEFHTAITPFEKSLAQAQANLDLTDAEITKLTDGQTTPADYRAAQQRNIGRNTQAIKNVVDRFRLTNDLTDQQQQAMYQQYGIGAQPAAGGAPTTAAMVKVQGPDGKTGMIPAANLQKAIAKGYKQLK